MPDGVLVLFADKAEDTAPIPEGELAAQMALLLPFEAHLLRCLAPALIRQVVAGARAWVAFPNDHAHMRAAVALNGLSQEFIAEHLERVALAFGAYTLRSLLPKGAGGAEESKDDAGLFGAVPGFRELMRRWAQRATPPRWWRTSPAARWRSFARRCMPRCAISRAIYPWRAA